MDATIDSYKESSYVDLTFSKPTNSRRVGRYIAALLEPIMGKGRVAEMCMDDAESLVTTPDRSDLYFEIHNLSGNRYGVRQFSGSDEVSSTLLELLVDRLTNKILESSETER